MTRRWMAIVVGSSLGLGFAFACSFPDVSYAPAGTSGNATSSGQGTSGGATTDGGPSSAPFEEKAVIDAAACVGRCDCDDDGYLADACIPDANEDVWQKEAGDCDDTYGLRHPYTTETWRQEEPKAGGGDFNCDGRVEKAYPVISRCETPLVGSCDSTEGFRADVPCGVAGDLVQCAKATPVSSCAVTNTGKRATQLCR